MKIIFLIVFTVAISGGFTAFSQNTEYPDKTGTADTSAANSNPFLNAGFEIKAFQNPDSMKTWGYDIYVDGRLYIHQPHVPAFGGNKGFETESDAKKVAALVEEKIKNNIIPPSVTTDEIKELGVIIK